MPAGRQVVAKELESIEEELKNLHVNRKHIQASSLAAQRSLPSAASTPIRRGGLRATTRPHGYRTQHGTQGPATFAGKEQISKEAFLAMQGQRPSNYLSRSLDGGRGKYTPMELLSKRNMASPFQQTPNLVREVSDDDYEERLLKMINGVTTPNKRSNMFPRTGQMMDRSTLKDRAPILVPSGHPEFDEIDPMSLESRSVVVPGFTGDRNLMVDLNSDGVSPRGYQKDEMRRRKFSPPGRNVKLKSTRSDDSASSRSDEWARKKFGAFDRKPFAAVDRKERSAADIQTRQTIASLEAAIEELRNKRKAEKDRNFDRMSKLSDENRDLSVELDRMVKEMSQLTSCLESTKIHLQHRESDLKRSEEQVDKSAQDLHRSQSELKDIRNELNETKSNLGSVKAELSEALNEKTRLELKVSDARRSCDHVQKDLSHVEDELVSAKATLKVQSQELERQKDELKSLKICNEQLSRSVDESHKDIEKGLTGIREGEKRFNKLHNEHMESLGRLERMQKETKRLEDSLSELRGSQQEAINLKGTLLQTKSEREKLIESNVSLNAELKRVNKQCTSQTEDLANYQNRCLIAEQELFKLRKLVEELRQQVPPLLTSKEEKKKPIDRRPKMFQQTIKVVGLEPSSEPEIDLQESQNIPSVPCNFSAAEVSYRKTKESPSKTETAGRSPKRCMFALPEGSEELPSSGRRTFGGKRVAGTFTLDRPPWAQDSDYEDKVNDRTSHSRDRLSDSLTEFLLEKTDIQSQLCELEGESAPSANLTSAELQRKRHCLTARLREIDLGVSNLRNQLYPKAQ